MPTYRCAWSTRREPTVSRLRRLRQLAVRRRLDRKGLPIHAHGPLLLHSGGLQLPAATDWSPPRIFFTAASTSGFGMNGSCHVDITTCCVRLISDGRSSVFAIAWPSSVRTTLAVDSIKSLAVPIVAAASPPSSPRWSRARFSRMALPSGRFAKSSTGGH